MARLGAHPGLCCRVLANLGHALHWEAEFSAGPSKRAIAAQVARVANRWSCRSLWRARSSLVCWERQYLYNTVGCNADVAIIAGGLSQS
jgi:hypothetical protein